MLEDEFKRPPDSLVEFCKCVDSDREKELRVRAFESPVLIIEYAEQLGFKFSLLQLRVWSRDLSADWFPWAGQSHQWRRDFFSKRG
jgi:hypothetical protein